MSELIFEVTQESDGGFIAECLTENIVTEADTWEELRLNVQEAVKGYYFDAPEKAPNFVRLNLLHDDPENGRSTRMPDWNVCALGMRSVWMKRANCTTPSLRRVYDAARQETSKVSSHSDPLEDRPNHFGGLEMFRGDFEGGAAVLRVVGVDRANRFGDVVDGAEGEQAGPISV